MFTRLSVSGVRALGAINIDLGPVTVLIGANGRGKTTLLHVLEFAASGGGGPLRSEMSSAKCRLEMTGDRQWNWRSNSSTAHGFASFDELFGARYLRLDPGALVAPSSIPEGDLTIGQRGELLAGAVTRLRLENPDVLEALQADLARVVPGFQRVRSGRSGGLFELRFDFRNVQDVPQAVVSTGTLLSLALLVLLHAERRTDRRGLLALIDDPETALHPAAQEELMRRMQAATSAGPVQVVCATHSPFIVDAAGAPNVWVLGPGQDGRSLARRLDSHPDAKRALEVLTAGEFWSSVGEDWVGKTA